ncbi:hypothetical protein EDB80DRAFT_568032 [Ilyonectria destructans]|nr:hypothetical protein EDB80DRAFT_568032 [Ilyonectria destructans]
MATTNRLSALLLSLFLILQLLALAVSAQDCSKTKLCSIGCCSKDGFCGTTSAHCGSGCLSTCDYKPTVTECSAKKLCATGCCSKDGFCGTTPAHCGSGCQSTCDFKLGCDKSNPCKDGSCCSKFGFCGFGPDCTRYCGLTEEFCGKKKVNRPSCSAKGLPMKRVVGYYEGWAPGRVCDKFKPSDIPDGVYTHLNFAFASIDPTTFQVVPAAKGDTELYRQVFISSLVSLMNTYNFDGVDIDWEYPEAPDRQGRGEDFANLPKFLRHIKSSLTQNGAKNGLSIAIPASYWYLQHFDIVNIAKYVDFFNVMTYDLHGSWDTPESWLGSHLNSHTNLTEIEDALDLLWRNKIDPDQVNLGLAFYSRTFTASSPGCMSPSCLFTSGAAKGPCSNAVGVLSNAEIDRKLQSVTGYKSRAVTTIMTNVNVGIPGGIFNEMEISESSTDVTKQQCRWSNCGQGCPSGWKAVLRRDPYKHNIRELMYDDTGCDGKATRVFCCPPGDQPFCQWLFFNGGKCNPGCPTGRGIEVASTKAGCNNGKAQVACCRGGGSSMDIYHQCQWYGKEHDCAVDLGTKSCGWSSTYNMLLFSSRDGSGAQNCQWYDNFALGLTPYAGEKTCNAKCPAGKIKIALNHYEWLCGDGTSAYCCDAEVTISADEKKKKLKEALNAWAKAPTCPNVKRRRNVPQISTAAVKSALQHILDHPPNSKLTEEIRDLWDAAMGTRWKHLSAATLSSMWYQAKDMYPNGDKGENLAAANGDDDRYYVDNAGGNCFAYGLANDGESDDKDMKWVCNKYGTVLPALDNTAVDALATCDMWKVGFVNGFPAWTKAGFTETPMKTLYNILGSVSNPSEMVNCESKLNNIKTSVSPRSVFGVWQYQNDEGIRERLITTHVDVANFLAKFEELYLKEYPKTPPMGLEDGHWREYMSKHVDRMVTLSKAWAEGRVNSLISDWTAHENSLL